MTPLYAQIRLAKSRKQKMLAILLDPDKMVWEQIDLLAQRINQSPATHVFVGGSHVENIQIDRLVAALKAKVALPVILFPGHPSQISTLADGILFLSLLSGRNPDFLIGHQVNAAPILKKSSLEVIPTAYLLIESGKPTAVEKVSQTRPMDRQSVAQIVATAQAGELLGHLLVYLEAGSGADSAVPAELIRSVVNNIEIPLIVGGGIKTKAAIQTAYDAGADLVVIGTAFENDLHFFD